MRDCGDKAQRAGEIAARAIRSKDLRVTVLPPKVTVTTRVTVRPRPSVKDDARAEFARQARELVASLEGKPDHERRDAIGEALDRFGQPRYALVADDALAVLREALG